MLKLRVSIEKYVPLIAQKLTLTANIRQIIDSTPIGSNEYLFIDELVKKIESQNVSRYHNTTKLLTANFTQHKNAKKHHKYV